jgi:uncharacterized protein YjdB
MKKKRCFTDLLIIVFLYRTVWAMNITGTVMNVKAHPIEGAYVELLGKGLSSVTDANGIFNFSDTRIKPLYQNSGLHTPVWNVRINNDRIMLKIGQAQRITMAIVNLQGKSVASLPPTFFAPGEYMYQIHPAALTKCVYILLLSAGDHSYISRLIPGINFQFSDDRVAAGPQVRPAKRLAAFDTLKVMMPGYETSITPIASYDEHVNITLTNITAIVTIKPNKDTLYLGNTARFVADAFGVGGADLPQGYRLAWESSDASVLTVDSLGNATAVAPGIVSLKATVSSAAKEQLCNSFAIVLVKRDNSRISFSIKIQPTDNTMYVDGTYNIFHSTVIPNNFMDYDCNLRWRSSAPLVIKVDSLSGAYDVIDSGRALITAALSSFSGALLCSDTLHLYSAWNSFVYPRHDTVFVGDTISLSATPFKDFCKKYGYYISWRSSNTRAISVDSLGRAAAAGLGSANIIFEVHNAAGALKTSDTAFFLADWQYVSNYHSTTYNWETVCLSYDHIGNIAYATVRDSTGGVFRSVDSGITWSRIAPKVSDDVERVRYSAVDIAPSDHSHVGYLFAGYYTQGLRISADNGIGWKNAKGGAWSFVFSQNSPNILYSISGWQVYKYDATNDSLFSLGKLPELSGAIPILLRDDSDPAWLYINAAAPYFSNDTGRTWQQIPSNQWNTYSNPIHVDKIGRIWAYDMFGIAGDWDYGILRSSDHGLTWQRLLSEKDSLHIKSILELKTSPRNPDFCCFVSNVGTCFYFSRDGGISWQKTKVERTSQYYSDIGSIAIINEDPLTVLISVGSQVWKYREPK